MYSNFVLRLYFTSIICKLIYIRIKYKVEEKAEGMFIWLKKIIYTIYGSVYLQTEL